MSRAVLRGFTPARVEMERAGHSLKTADLLALRAAQAEARDAVHAVLDSGALARQLEPLESICVSSAAADRTVYLNRPDLGRRLHEASREPLLSRRSSYHAVFILADGLSALAVERHGAPMIAALIEPLRELAWKIAPVILVEQARVAIGDEIGSLLGAELVVVLIGERPGMTSPASLGAYLTWNPRTGLTDADRNCVSNIHGGGLSYAEAAHKIVFLLTEARRRKLSGVSLKEDAGPMLLSGYPSLPASAMETE